jgi:hypothetical protein
MWLGVEDTRAGLGYNLYNELWFSPLISGSLVLSDTTFIVLWL